MNKVKIRIASWEMQCCGTPFKVGDNVKWTVCRGTDSGDESFSHKGIGDFDYFYDEHDCGEPQFVLTGTVVDIRAVCTLYELRPYEGGSKVKECYYAVEHKLSDFDGVADGWTEITDGEYKFSGYLVQAECKEEPQKVERGRT
jgi:hypothetical protein